MKRKLRVHVVGIAVAVSLALAGCAGVGGGGSAKNDNAGGANPTMSAVPDSGLLSLMGVSAQGDEVGMSRIKLYKQQHPKVTLKMNEGGFDAQQFLTAVKSKNPPDLVYLDRGLIGTYAARGTLQPLESCISGQGIDMTQFRPAAQDEEKYDGKIYGIPEFYTVQAILADAKVLKGAGVKPSDLDTSDWGALETVAKKLYASKDGKPTRIGFDPKLPEFLPLWAQANGTSLVNPDGSPNLDDPKVAEALDYAVRLVDDQGGWAKFKAFRDTWDFFGSKNQVASDQIGAWPMENWYVNVLVDTSPNVDLTAVPFKDKQGKPISMLGGSAWAIPTGSKNAALACNFAKTMTSADAWAAAGAARDAKVKKDKSIFTGLFTGNKAADEAIKSKYVKPSGNQGFDTAIEDYYQALDYATARVPSPASQEITDAWTKAATRALNHQGSAADLLAKAQTEAKSAYDRAKAG
jgi:multiple sugar transport system substrate-binding protein